ncbi:MAG TPA: hypothetical protein VF145_13020 [Chitinophagaceae bacterium]
MRSILLSLSVIGIIFLSCQKEISVDSGYNTNPPPAGGPAVFTMAGAPNSCTGAVISGYYATGTTLDSAAKVTISVNVTTAGSYTITTDTVNGYKFAASGTFTGTGTQTVVLKGSGTPQATGTDVFTPKIATSKCTFSITVAAPAPAAFTLAGSPGACASATVNGNYSLGTALTGANTVSLQVNVTTPGTYTISTNTVGGMTFSASGAFGSTGIQNVTLTGSGTPSVAGANVITPQVGTSTCTFTVNVMGPAVFTLAGAPGACTSPVINGTYTLGTALAAANTVTVSVNVTTTGSYSLATNTVGGMTFSKSGTFTTTGSQTVVLAGSGTPTTAGANVFTVGTNGCTFTVPVVGPAAFTYEGGSGACTGVVVNGTYTAGAALTSANNVVIKVNVTTVGAYTISTNASGGIQFSKSGVFTTTGIQNVTLNGTGTPNAPGTHTFTVGTNGCTFDVTVPLPTGTYSCKVDGVLVTFNDRARAQVMNDFFSPPVPYLYLDGYTGPPNGSTVPEFQIFIEKNDNSAVGTGTYNVDSYTLPTGGYRIEIDYTVVNPDLSVTIWNNSSSLFSQSPPFNIVITSRTATRITGTFSGTLKNTLQGGTLSKTITEGVFDLPIY